jgi:hypothetical protein
MGSKIQGEGDYESARRYNDETKRFVDEKTRDGKPLTGNAAEASDTLSAAEKEALSHAKKGEQDKRDAQILKDLEKKHAGQGAGGTGSGKA